MHRLQTARGHLHRLHVCIPATASNTAHTTGSTSPTGTTLPTYTHAADEARAHLRPYLRIPPIPLLALPAPRLNDI